MNAEVEEYYSINKSFLSCIGGWPYQCKVLRVLLPCMIIVIDISGIATMVLLIFNHLNDIDMVIEGISSLPIVFVAMTKLINLVVNNDKLKHLLSLMNDHWRTFNSESELHILRYYADLERKVTKYYAVFIYTAFVMYMSMPLIPKLLDIVIPLNESRPLVYVYEGEYGIDKEKYYYLILLYNFGLSAYNVTIIISVDTIYMTCVLHACSLFVAIGDYIFMLVIIVIVYCALFLRHCLENIVSEDDTDIVETDVGVRIYTNLDNFLAENLEKRHHVVDDYYEMIACLKKHQLVLQYVEKLNSMFTTTTLLLLIILLLQISVIGLQIINHLGEKEEMIKGLSLTTGTLFNLICMCLPGQLLIDRSVDVFNKAYSSRWYTFSVKSKRLIRILLCRSVVPSTLTAGNMYVMSMVTCSMVMRTAMSYFTAFLSMK